MALLKPEAPSHFFTGAIRITFIHKHYLAECTAVVRPILTSPARIFYVLLPTKKNYCISFNKKFKAVNYGLLCSCGTLL